MGRWRALAAGLVALTLVADAAAQSSSSDGSGGSSALTLTKLDAYPGAVCNDGSAAGYYYSKGSDSSLWVVYLQGARAPLGRRPLFTAEPLFFAAGPSGRLAPLLTRRCSSRAPSSCQPTARPRRRAPPQHPRARRRGIPC